MGNFSRRGFSDSANGWMRSTASFAVSRTESEMRSGA